MHWYMHGGIAEDLALPSAADCWSSRMIIRTTNKKKYHSEAGVAPAKRGWRRNRRPEPFAAKSKLLDLIRLEAHLHVPCPGRHTMHLSSRTSRIRVE